METKFNLSREVNKLAERLGMKPGDKKIFELDVMAHGNGAFSDVTYYITSAELKEGKSGNTKLRLHGKVQYPMMVKYYDFGLWAIEREKQIEIFNIISK